MDQPAPSPDYGRTVAFLRWYEPLGPWCLTGIHISHHGTPTATFDVGEDAAMLQWLTEHGAQHNLYFTVNRVRQKVSKKPAREDIAEVRWLHVDVDPRAGEPLAAEQARILAEVTQPSPKGLPRPSLITFSGGGYQAFWRLTDPIQVIDLDHCERIKRYNLQIERLLGGDHCHNVDRIMRLPFTVNWPGEKKRRAGRTPALADVIIHTADAYSLSLFQSAPELQAATPLGFSGGTVAVGSNVRRLASMDELPASVTPRTRVLIAQGFDPDEPNKYASRSEAMWAVLCDLVRADVDNDTIFAVITDPEWKISEHVLAQRGNRERYALRQIERAREDAVDPWLRILNERHAVIGDTGGKCRVITDRKEDGGIDRSTVSRQSFDDFRNQYLARIVQVGSTPKGEPVMKPVGHWWLQHPKHRHFDTMVFAPGKELPGAYNLWQGFACESAPGDCSLFLAHVHDVICSGADLHYTYLMAWMARAVQEPGTPGEIAVVLKGKMGTGKGVFARWFGSLFGRHYLHVSNSKHLVGNFNAHLRDCVVLFADEAFYAGDKKNEGLLKTLITEGQLVIEAKGVDVETCNNCTHLIMASNEKWAVPASLGDRRFFVLDVSNKHVQDHDYFAAIAAEMDAGGREALLHHLLAMDLNGWDVRKRPWTIALAAEQVSSLDTDEEWWYSKLCEGVLSPNDSGWPDRIVCEALHDDYVAHCRKWRPLHRTVSLQRLGQFLTRAMPGGVQRRRSDGSFQYLNDAGLKVTKDRPNFYLVPPLVECRAHWNSEFQALVPWPTASMELLPPPEQQAQF